MRLLLLMALLIFVPHSLAFAPVPIPKKKQQKQQCNAADLMVGEWQGPHHLLVITKGRAVYDPHAVRPREYDLRVDTSGDLAAYDMLGTSPVSVAGRHLRGIFKVEGDTLTLCYHSAGRERPTSFDGPGRGTYTAVYKRKKKPPQQ